MTHRDIDDIRDGLNRIAKLDIDTGAAEDVEAAVARLGTHRLDVHVGTDAARCAAHQAALLTFVNVARRFALGGVRVVGDLDLPLLVGGLGERSLRDEIEFQGGLPGSPFGDVPAVVIGSPVLPLGQGVAMTFEGWRGAVVPLHAPRLSERTGVMPAAVLAGALAASEAFSMLRGDVEAGHRSVGLSLWRPDRSCDWRTAEPDEPETVALPTSLWILGLGHLGQALLWTLLMCPYRKPGEVRLILQDIDTVTRSTDSTSILTQPTMVGRLKTRAVAEVMERHGFGTALIERRFDGDFKRSDASDPAVLICGVDNALARSRLEEPGFPFVVEAGIGDGAQDFRAMRIHTFPARRPASHLWVPGAAAAHVDLDKPAYTRLSREGGDICGLTRLAGTAVGAPFVGTVAGCLMLAQILRLITGDAPDALVDLDLKAVGARRAVTNEFVELFNPGYQLP